MLKNLFDRDEIKDQAEVSKKDANKQEKLTKKEILEKEKPIDPKYIFNNYKKSKADKGKSYRKPDPETDGKKPTKLKMITINDY